MKKSFTLAEAWQLLDKMYPYQNVYDAYVLKQDWLIVLDNMDKKAEADANLNSLERTFGISELNERLQSIGDRLNALSLPSGSGWKYTLTDEVAAEFKKKAKQLKAEKKIIEEQIDEISGTIRIEPELLGLKN